ncbi:hypothetical protein ACFXTN_017076 [Malus domestica]
MTRDRRFAGEGPHEHQHRQRLLVLATLGIAVSAFSTMCAPYYLELGLLLAAAHPDVAPSIVNTWSRIKRKLHTDGSERRDSVRKMQLEARDDSLSSLLLQHLPVLYLLLCSYSPPLL